MLSFSFGRRALFLLVASGAVTLAVLLSPSSLWSLENLAESELRLQQAVAFLASDELEGRGVGTTGLDKAADYIAQQFAALGLKTDLYNGRPFQEFEITVAAEPGPAAENRLAFTGPLDSQGQRQTAGLHLGESFRPLAVGGSGSFEAPLVFAGYGITAKNLKRGNDTISYDDFAGIDVKGKVVLILRKEPQQKDPHSPFDGTRPSEHAAFQRKISNASQHGAAAAIFVNDGLELISRREQNAKLKTAAQEKLAEARKKLEGVKSTDADYEKTAAAIKQAESELAELEKSAAAGDDTLLPFTGAGDKSTYRKLPIYFCTRSAINPVLKAALGKDLVALEAEIDADLVPRSAALAGWRASGESKVIERKAQVKNVLAVLEGHGPLADETIVIGAHYDHLGHGGAGSLAPWTTDIHNGADDNASGTATLLEVAHRLVHATHKPRRRIVFMAFTGEEMGLLGSAQYTRQPRFPLGKTIAMFNLDMVGRLNEDKLIVYGTGTAQEFDSLLERFSQAGGFKLTKHTGGFGPSDHSSFYSKKIPVLHFFTGTHRDYHRPSDDTERLNIAGMRRVADLLEQMVEATDASDRRPTYVDIRRVERIDIAADEGGERPSFGSMPDYANSVEDGVLLQEVFPGSPADRAGIKGGDILIRFGESRIMNVNDFEIALRKHKPGDKVKVAVRRGKEIIEAEATLARPRPLP